jgi:hypothetical protein
MGGPSEQGVRRDPADDGRRLETLSRILIVEDDPAILCGLAGRGRCRNAVIQTIRILRVPVWQLPGFSQR